MSSDTIGTGDNIQQQEKLKYLSKPIKIKQVKELFDREG
jgi:hypothetical protein